MRILSARNRLLFGLLIAFTVAPAAADFLKVNRVVSLGVLNAYPGFSNLNYNPDCSDPWDGDEVTETCTWDAQGYLQCPAVQEDPPRGDYLDDRWNRFIGCYGGTESDGFWVRGPAESCTAPSGKTSFWSTDGTGEICCEPTAYDSDTSPEGCVPNSVPTWGHASAAVFGQACEAAVAVKEGIPLEDPIPGFEGMVTEPPEPGHAGDEVTCTISKKDLHALMLAQQPPATPESPPGLDAASQ